MAMVKINNPRLMLSCGDEDLLLNCSSRRVTSYCDETGQYETVFTYSILILVSPGQDKCDWLNLPYKINVANIEVIILFPVNLFLFPVH